MRKKPTYEERIESARQIVQDNLQLLYHLPRGYRALNRVLEHEELRRTLLAVLNHIKGREIYIYRQKYVFHLDNKAITKIRGKTTTSVSNKYMNFLCCIGLINKQYQNPGEVEHLTAVNKAFLQKYPDRFPINTYYIRRYTPAELDRLEVRAQQLIDNKVKPGNISKDLTIGHNSRNFAIEVFFNNSDKSMANKEKAFQIVLQSVTEACQAKGYTTKAEICRNTDIKRDALDRLLKVFETEWQQQYIYKAPNRADKEKYGLTEQSWIITRRNSNGEKEGNTGAEAEQDQDS